MKKDFKRKRINHTKDFFSIVDIVKENAEELNEVNVATYWCYCFCGNCSDKEKVEFVNLVKSMVELDSQFEDWKLHLDKSKTIEQVLNELRVYIDKFDKISEKLRTIAHSNMYEPYCTYPNIILDKFIR